VAFYEDVAIAASVYFHFGTTAVYKYGASDKQYQHLRANNLVMWEAIRWLCGQGFSNLHFGRTDLDHAGLRQFKTGWGAAESKLSYHRYNLRTSAFDSNGSRASQAHTKLFRRMPMPVLNFLGSVLYRHMG
jgi:lipid II:glycine glycyltransferase (peptidoglycan interpeptide bridge formation enzyme)